MEQNKKGTVYLVGAGPGDPGLLTLKAKACLEEADVVIYDYLANEAFLDHADKKAEMIYVGKKGGDHTLSQEEINKLIVDKAQKGLAVVRLKGGDPFIFGRGGEEAEELVKAGVSFEVVPPLLPFLLSNEIQRFIHCNPINPGREFSIFPELPYGTINFNKHLLR